MWSRAIIFIGLSIHNFLQVDSLSYCPTQLGNPFELLLCRGYCLLEESVESFTLVWHSYLAIFGIDEDLFLVGFLAIWLCTFLLLIKEGFVLSSVLLVVSWISRGERLSLALVVFARMYGVMRAILESNSLEL